MINGRYTGKPGREVREQLGAMSTYVLDSMYGLEESLQYRQGPKRLTEMNQRSASLRQFVLATVAMMSSFGLVSALSALSTTLAQTIAAARWVLELLDEQPLIAEKAAHRHCPRLPSWGPVHAAGRDYGQPGCLE